MGDAKEIVATLLYIISVLTVMVHLIYTFDNEEYAGLMPYAAVAVVGLAYLVAH